MSIGRFSVRNSVLINILMITVLVLGAFSLTRLPREQFSEVPFFWVNVIVPYPGVSAEDIEKSVTIPVERELQGLERVKQIGSVTQEGLSVVRVEFDEGISNEEFARLFQQAQTRFGKVDLPEGTLQPVIDDFSSSDFLPVIEVVLSGEAEYPVLSRTARLLRERLLGVRQVSQVELVGARDRQVLIEADREKLEASGISLDEIVQSVRLRNRNVPGGTLQSGTREYLLRTLGEVGSVGELGRVIVRQAGAPRVDAGQASASPEGSGPGGHGRAGAGVVRLGDVARVVDGFDPDGVDARFNGSPAILLRVEKVPRGNSIGVIDGIKREVAAFESVLPVGVEVSLFNDSTVQIRDSLRILITNALLGFALLVIILFLFIGLRNALITALGIPVTFAITFVVLELFGETLNGNSLFALVLVLGLIVDHAIVIIENSYRLRQEGLSAEAAAIRGADEVVAPVIAATLTTVAAFLPLMILPGIIGRFLRVIPLVVTIALLASTFEAVVFLPVHFAEWSSRVRSAGRDIFVGLQAPLRRLVAGLVRRRYRVVGLAFLVVIGSFFLVTTLKQDLFSGEDQTLFFIDIEMAVGTPLARTNAVVAEYEERILQRLGGGEVEAVSSSAGFSSGTQGNAARSNVAQLTVDIIERTQGRTRPLSLIMDEVRNRTSDIPGPETVRFRKQQGGPPVDPPISFRLFGDDYEEMARVTADFKGRLAGYPELFDIQDNLEPGTPELRIRVNESRAAQLGLSAASIGAFIRSSFDGVPATTLFDRNEELDVIVKYAGARSLSVDSLTQLKIPTPDGRQIPFSSVARLEEGAAVAAIKRVDGKREVTITAEAYDKANIRAINAGFEDLFRREYAGQYPGMTFSARGEFAELSNLLVQILRVFLIGAFLIFVILGTQFRSYGQPLLILFAIPFSFVGVILYLFVSGTPFSTTVLYAAVALAGIVVNDSIVLIDRVNDLRRRGSGLIEAVTEATAQRLRPILLTTMTTIAGLLPTAIGIGGRSPVWSPMASTIIFGLIFSTLAALLITPCLYAILADLTGRRGRKALGSAAEGAV